MKKLFVWMLMAVMTMPIFAQENDAVKQTMHIFENKQWVIIPESANIANSIQVDGMQPDRNYFSMEGDNMEVKIDFTGARGTANMGEHKAEAIVDEIYASGNDPESLPPMYIATYKIDKQDISTDKKGHNVIVKFGYTVEHSNTTNLGANPQLEVRVRLKDMHATVRLEGFRMGETYYGKLMERQVIK